MTTQSPSTTVTPPSEQDTSSVASTSVSYHLESNWSDLVGEEIQIRLRGRRVRTGVVDAASRDGRFLWVAAHGNDSRILLDRDEGYEAWKMGSAHGDEADDVLPIVYLILEPPTSA